MKVPWRRPLLSWSCVNVCWTKANENWATSATHRQSWDSGEFSCLYMVTFLWYFLVGYHEKGRRDGWQCGLFLFFSIFLFVLIVCMWVWVCLFVHLQGFIVNKLYCSVDHCLMVVGVFQVHAAQFTWEAFSADHWMVSASKDHSWPVRWRISTEKDKYAAVLSTTVTAYYNQFCSDN